MSPSSCWLRAFSAQLIRQDTVQALACLRAAHAKDPGWGPDWPRALDDCLQAGWVAGCQQLLAWGIAPPGPRARVQAIERAARHASPQAWISPAVAPGYRLPSGEAIAPLSGKAIEQLGGILCSPPSPPLSAGEWSQVWECDQALAHRVLENGGVRPWEGARAARAMLRVLDQALAGLNFQQAWTVDMLPAGFPAWTPRLVPTLVGWEARRGHGLRPSANSHDPMVLALDACALSGSPILEISHALKKQSGEDLFIWALRYNRPGVFAALLAAGGDPWVSRVKVDTRADPLSNTPTLGLLIQRLASCEDLALLEAWWALVAGLVDAPQAHAPAPPGDIAWRLDNPSDRHRWDSLLQKARLERRLPCVAEPTGRQRL